MRLPYLNRLASVMVLALLTFVTPGCHRQVVVTNTPAGVSPNAVANWYAATGEFKLAADYTKQLTEATIALHAEGGVFPDEDTYQKTLAALGRAAQIEVQASQFLNTVPNNWNQDISKQVAGYANDLATQVQLALDDGLAHVKNQDKLSALKTTMTLLHGVIATIAKLV